MPRKCLVLYHPRARGLQDDGLRERTRELHEQLGPGLELRRGDDPDLDEHLRTLDPERDAIVVLGGDGTLHHAIRRVASVLGEESPWPRFGFLPAGTANDGARSIEQVRGEPSTLASIAASLRADRIAKSADLGRVVCPATGFRRFFVSFAGLGGACDWVRIADSRWFAPVKRLGAAIAYPLCSLAVILRARRTDLSVSIDDAPRDGARLFTLFVAKGRYLGGGLDLGSDVRLDSGRLAVVAIRAGSRTAILRQFLAAQRGGASDSIAARRVRLRIPSPAAINLDGELVRFDAPHEVEVEIDVAPGRIRWA